MTIMKGQALTHALVTGFGVVIIIILIVVLTNSASQYKTYVAESELGNVCLLVASAVEDIQPLSSYRSATPTLLAVVRLELPDRIGSVPYRVSFIDGNVTVETQDNPKRRASCAAGFGQELRGSSNGGLTEVRLVRTSVGDMVEMVKL